MRYVILPVFSSVRAGLILHSIFPVYRLRVRGSVNNYYILYYITVTWNYSRRSVCGLLISCISEVCYCLLLLTVKTEGGMHFDFPICNLYIIIRKGSV